jgi:uncharacterized protein YndB with AHSA1/START domain
MHDFDLRVGGGYRMSLFYPASERDPAGKTAAGEDRFSSRFLTLDPPSRIVEVITFDADDAAFSGEMVMEVTLVEREDGTDVTVAFRDLPPGIRPEDNDAGTRSSLEKLARLVEQRGQQRA